jgi:hypothetical protein
MEDTEGGAEAQLGGGDVVAWRIRSSPIAIVL